MTIDLRWKIPLCNQLWLKWEKIKKDNNNVITLINPYFTGEVLADCSPIEKAGFINLDLTKHYIILINQPYLVKISWKELLSQSKDKAIFKSMIIDDPLGLLNKLSNSDTILLDCTGHTEEAEAKGSYLQYFSAMVYKETMEPYDFSS